MDITFTCPNCKQQLEAPTSLSGTAINCPSCNHQLVIPEADPANLRVVSDGNAARLEEKHFVVPVSEKPTESLIHKPLPPLDVAATRADGEKSLRVKCIRHSDCVEVGHDRFEQMCSDFLKQVGEANIVKIDTFNYEHQDLATRQMVTDYGLMVIYRD